MILWGGGAGPPSALWTNRQHCWTGAGYRGRTEIANTVCCFLNLTSNEDQTHSLLARDLSRFGFSIQADGEKILTEMLKKEM